MKSHPNWRVFWHGCLNLVLLLYKNLLSPIIAMTNHTLFGFHSRCLHTPTCSQYFVISVRDYGIIQGGLKGLRRLLSCQNIAK